MLRFTKEGRELPDPTPMEIPAGFQRPLTLQEQIERCFRGLVSRNAEARGFESLEEATDFDVPDDQDPTDAPTRYTMMETEVLPDGDGADATHDTRRAAGEPTSGPGGDEGPVEPVGDHSDDDDSDVSEGPDSGHERQRRPSGTRVARPGPAVAKVRSAHPQGRTTGAGAARRPIARKPR